MRKSLIAVFALAALIGFNTHAAIIIRGFEDRAAGQFTTQYPEFTITTDTLNATLYIQAFAKYASEGSNFLTITDPVTNWANGNGIFTAAAGYELLGISFKGIDSNVGVTVANVSLFSSSGTNLGVLNVLAPGSDTTAVQMDFSSYSSVGRFEVRNVTDIGGFAIDRIVVNAVPEPSAISLLVVGLGGVAALRRVRRKAD